MSLMSRPYRPDRCCERCCFGSGEHAEWCKDPAKPLPYNVHRSEDELVFAVLPVIPPAASLIERYMTLQNDPDWFRKHYLQEWA